MGNRMNQQRWCRLGFVSLLALTLFGETSGLGAAEPDAWMQRFEAGVTLTGTIIFSPIPKFL